MFTLVLVYCLSAELTSCVEKRPMLEDAPPGAMGCMVLAQQAAQPFLKEHPLYSLVRWRCEPAEKPAEKSA